MRWHPQRGLGVIVLGNGTYSAARTAATDMLNALLDTGRRPAVGGPPPHGRRAWQATCEARADIERLLDKWDDAIAARWFAGNVDLDEPISRRRDRIERIREQVGRLRPEDGIEPVHDSPSHCAWWLRGPNGRVRVEIRLTPEKPPRVQTLDLTTAVAPDARLRPIVDQLIAALNAGSPEFPPAVATAPSIDRGKLTRLMRLATGWAGTCQRAEVRAGNGVTATTIKITGESGDLMMTVQTERDSAVVKTFGIELAL
jgi:hypothetical protein